MSVPVGVRRLGGCSNNASTASLSLLPSVQSHILFDPTAYVNGSLEVEK